MLKIQKISELEPTIGFTEFAIYTDYGQSFLSSESGRLKSLLPLASLAKSLCLKENLKGRPSYFSPESKIALMFLKSYTGFSDRALVTHLNSNIHCQLFCGIRIHPLNPVTNFKIISEIRRETGRKSDMDSLQQILADSWKPCLEHPSIISLTGLLDETIEANRSRLELSARFHNRWTASVLLNI